MTKKVTYELERFDSETGEVKTISRDSILPREPDFVKLYLEDVARINNVPSWADSILYQLLRQMNYRNEIVLNATVKKRIGEELDLSMKTINNALGLLVKKQILFREGIGVYIGNPMLFGKGEWKDIRELRLKVQYSKKGRHVSTEITKEHSQSGQQLDLVDMLDSLKQTA